MAETKIIAVISYSVVQGGCPASSTCPNIITADPRLGGLGYDGVLMHALGSGSSAINAANPAYCPATDQRGYPRRGAGGFCDIGAYEAQPTSVVAANGSPQGVAINTAFPVALQARVADTFGNLLGGSVVTFTVPASGASAAWSGSLTLTRTTNISGTVTAPTLTANDTADVFTASAATSAGAATFFLTNLKGNTTTTITSSKNPSLPGEAVTFTVTVTSPSGTPTGTVEFYETTSPAASSFDSLRGSGRAQALASKPLVGGVVTFTASSLAVGTHTMLALYSGDTNYDLSISAQYAQVVDPLPLYSLTVNYAGNDSGTVLKSPDAISYTAGTVVTLTAVSDAGSTFGGWSGAIVTTTNPLVLTLDAAQAVTATFNLISACEPVGGVGFTFTPLTPRVGQNVAFTGSVISGTTPITYTWGWGDNTAADSGANMPHTFPLTNTMQTYTVTLNVSNACSGPISVVQPVTVQPRRVYLPLIQK